jgi:hypothetical protein
MRHRYAAGHVKDRSTRVRSLRAALKEFLLAPSLKGSSNEQLIVQHLGVKGIHVVDPPSFDAVADKYEKKIDNFEQAFYACWRGQRDWLRFDIATLRECDDLGALQLPQRIEDEIIRSEEAAERAAIAGEEYFGVDAPPDEAEFAPPLELLRRAPPRRRRRWKRLSRTARGRTKLAKQYREAKAAYHRAGRALRCSHERCATWAA